VGLFHEPTQVTFDIIETAQVPQRVQLPHGLS
jgi:hypothetical protein